MEAAISASSLSGRSGLQGYLSYEGRLFGLNFSAAAQRTFDEYEILPLRPQELPILRRLTTAS